MKETSTDITFIALDAAVATPARDGFYMLLKDRWWAVCPRRGLLMYRKHSPQCNRSEAVVRSMVERIYPWAEALLIPTVFIPIEPRDYV